MCNFPECWGKTWCRVPCIHCHFSRTRRCLNANNHIKQDNGLGASAWKLHTKTFHSQRGEAELRKSLATCFRINYKQACNAKLKSCSTVSPMLKTDNSAATVKLVISEDHGPWAGKCANSLYPNEFRMILSDFRRAGMIHHRTLSPLQCSKNWRSSESGF